LYSGDTGFESLLWHQYLEHFPGFPPTLRTWVRHDRLLSNRFQFVTPKEDMTPKMWRVSFGQTWLTTFREEYHRKPASWTEAFRHFPAQVRTPCPTQCPRDLRHKPSSPLERWRRGFEFHSRHGCLCTFFCVRVVCVGSGLATGWSPVKGVIPGVYKLRNWKRGPSSKGAVEPERDGCMNGWTDGRTERLIGLRDSRIDYSMTVSVRILSVPLFANETILSFS
jgi:hypothetical protein